MSKKELEQTALRYSNTYMYLINPSENTTIAEQNLYLGLKHET